MAKNLRAQDELNKARNAAKAPRSSAKQGSTRKTSIFALLLMAFAILIFLALVSYDASDEANADLRFTDIYKVFTADPIVKAKADTAHNWLGLVGSMISEFLIKSTIGYSIFSLPFLLMVFGWTILRRKQFRRLFVITNYTLVFSLLLAMVFGMMRVISNGAWRGMEWRGVGGYFLSLILSQLLGRTG